MPGIRGALLFGSLAGMTACPGEGGKGGAGDTSSGETEDTGVGDSGSGGDTGGGDSTISLLCDGSRDDGRAIKFCAPSAYGGIGLSLSRGCDLDGDRSPELVFGYRTQVEGVDVSGIYIQQEFTHSVAVSGAPDVTAPDLDGFGGLPNCEGDRDGDGLDDLAALGETYAGTSVTERVFVLDGPVVPGETSADAIGEIDSAGFEPWASAWVDGGGTGEGDGLLVGQAGNVDGHYYTYLERSPVGLLDGADADAIFIDGAASELYVGMNVESADMDGDGVADLLLGVYEDYYDDIRVLRPHNAIMVVPGDASGTNDLDPGLVAGTPGGVMNLTDEVRLGPLGDAFSVGDLDDDGYPDLEVRLSDWLERDYHAMIGVYYGLQMGQREPEDADAFVDPASDHCVDHTEEGAIVTGFDGDEASGALILTCNDHVYLYADPPAGDVDASFADADLLIENSRSLQGVHDVGDLNDDGLEDIAFNAPYDQNVDAVNGSAYILFGGAW